MNLALVLLLLILTIYALTVGMNNMSSLTPQQQSLHVLCIDAEDSERACFTQYLKKWGLLKD